MAYSTLLNTFAQFGLAAILGFVIGLERELRGGEEVTMGLRDFVLFSLLGAVSAFIAFKFDSYWPVVTAFIGLLLLILSRYWMERSRDAGITTEVAGLMTFSLGVLVIMGYTCSP